VAAPVSAPPAGVAAPARAVAAIAPRIAEGRTELRDGLFAIRRGDSVVVHFDTPHARTRRPDKFERIVRATLAEVYGAPVESALAMLPEGEVARQGELLTELPARGVHLALPGGGRLALWPATRPGRDGPLVVTYVVVTTR
jgi:hypothetical protein